MQHLTTMIKWRIRAIMYFVTVILSILASIAFVDDMLEHHMKEIARLERYPTVYMSMYVRHTETTTYTPICAALIGVADGILLLWLLLVYMRVVPKYTGRSFGAVQGCVLMVIASAALWMLQIAISVGLPVSLVLISFDIFTDDICVYFMIMGVRSDDLYLSFFGGCHRCFSRLCFDGQGMERDRIDGGYYNQAVDSNDDENEQDEEKENTSSGDVASDVQLI